MGLVQDANDTGYRPITLEAHDLVFGDRQGSYGHPLDDFTCTAAMWTAYLQHKGLMAPGDQITAEDVGPMMICVKLSRQANSPKSDNMVDTAGYAETTERVIFERARRAREEAAFIALLADSQMARELGLRESDLKFPKETGHFTATPEERAQSFAAAARAGGAILSPEDEAQFLAAAQSQRCPCGDPDPTHAVRTTQPPYVPEARYRCQAEPHGDKR